MSSGNCFFRSLMEIFILGVVWVSSEICFNFYGFFNNLILSNFSFKLIPVSQKFKQNRQLTCSGQFCMHCPEICAVGSLSSPSRSASLQLTISTLNKTNKLNNTITLFLLNSIDLIFFKNLVQFANFCIFLEWIFLHLFFHWIFIFLGFFILIF
jgi:hypothetical protein